MSQFIHGKETKGLDNPMPEPKNPPFSGFASEQLAGFSKPSATLSNNNKNRHYQDEVSVGDVGSYQLKGQSPKKTKI